MAKRTLDVIDIIEILVHWQAGRNNRRSRSPWAWTGRRAARPAGNPSEPY